MTSAGLGLATRLQVLIRRAALLVVLIGLTGAAGVGLGLAMTLPVRDLLVSVVVISLHLIVILYAPVPGLLLWIIFYPFTETRVNLPLGAGVPDLSVTRFVAALLVFILLAQTAAGRRPFPRLRWLDVWGGLFVAGMGLSAVSSSDPIRSITSVLDDTLMPLVFYFLAKNLFTTRADLDRLFDALLVMAGYSACLAIYEQLTGSIVLAPDTYRLEEYAHGIRILRSLWGNNAVFGSILAFALPVAFYRLTQPTTRAGRLAYAATTGLLLLGMFFTYKRAAWISMAVSFVILAAFAPAMRRVLAALALALSVPLALMWNQVTASDLVEQRLTSNYATLNGRTNRWEVALSLWQEDPLLGHGFQSFDQLSGYTAVESQYLHVLVSGGLVAFVPFLTFLFLAFRASVRLYLRGPTCPDEFVDRTLVVVFWAVASTYLVKGFTGTHSTPIHLIFYILIGALVASQGELFAHREQTPGWLTPAGAHAGQQLRNLTGAGRGARGA